MDAELGQGSRIEVTGNAVAERRSLIPSSLAWGLPLILAVAVPWFVVAHLRSDGEFTRVFFFPTQTSATVDPSAPLIA